MTMFQGIILGVIQGITEFLPISSSGHLVLVHSFFGISAFDLSYDALLQLATALAVICFFFNDIVNLIKTVLRLLFRVPVENKDKHMAWALVLGTIPAVFLGVLLESYMETIFRNSHLVAFALIFGSVLMWCAEKYYSGKTEITPSKGFGIGLFQSLALVPGVSRSGASISGAMLLGLTRTEATRFSFLLSLPIIIGSGLKKTIELSSLGILTLDNITLWAAFVSAFIVGLFTIRFLLKFISTYTLKYFIVYRLILAFAILAFL